ncbi:hypothetical protein B0J18DRAFT_421946 [Chaetomium sp. MPI-SDFR-AT-0129]|nr:hypothetical protein B0J18DRAFT_421946 [Chaetomium sp. MPI-SDFR-AT-0129]
MNEVAWCYFEGFGTKKDKVSSVFTISMTCPRRPPHSCFYQRLAFSGFSGSDLVARALLCPGYWAPTGFRVWATNHSPETAFPDDAINVLMTGIP